MLVPGLLAGHTIAMLHTSRSPRERRVFIGLGVLALALPLALQGLGLMPESYAWHANGIVILPVMSWFEPLPTRLTLGLCSVAAMLIPVLLVARMRRVLDEAERRLQLQSWHLRKLVPDEAIEAVPRSRVA